MTYQQQSGHDIFTTGTGKRLRSLLMGSVCSVALVMAVPGLAENGGGSTGAGGAAQQGGGGAQAEVGKPASGSNVDKGTAITKQNIRASDFMGAKVKNPKGETVGEVSDLMLNWKGHKINYAVLSHGGLVGIGSKNFAVPLSAFKAASQGNALILDVSVDELEKRKGFKAEEPPQSAKADQWGAGSAASKAGAGQSSGSQQGSEQSMSGGGNAPADQDKMKQTKDQMKSGGQDQMEQGTDQMESGGQDQMEQGTDQMESGGQDQMEQGKDQMKSGGENRTE